MRRSGCGWWAAAGWALVACCAFGCGRTSAIADGAANADTVVVDDTAAGADVANIDSENVDASGTAADAGAPLAAAVAAAKTAAEADPTCTGLAPFYWEIGDVNGTLGGGSTGAGLIKADTALNIASASKFFWGAYVVERFKADLSAVDANAMTMRSGRTNFNTCMAGDTVASCCGQPGAAGAATKNCDVTAAEVGFFNYGGAHFQQYAADLGLGADDNSALGADLKKLLGMELELSFTQPQPAGGGKASAATYAGFLRKILSGGLALHDHLGGAAVCTLPATCPQAHSSPVPRAWHYSYGHWVEDDPNGDGAFSSPGLFGFYPWIDAGKQYYGILAREALRNLTGMLADAPYYQSVVCGEAIRHAFLGVAKP
ncbi:MAG TPA: hypothetical protein VGL59_02210 [Polyangia bacterium]|jgi:hypothetical protein